jgi:hypothetical protein
MRVFLTVNINRQYKIVTVRTAADNIAATTRKAVESERRCFHFGL